MQPGPYVFALIHEKRSSRYSSRTKCNVNGAFDSEIHAKSDFVIADPGATMTFVAGGALKPIGGHILSHASATRMFLRKGRSVVHNESLDLHYLSYLLLLLLGRAEERVAKLVDSPDRPESEASYKLDEGGWADV